MFKFEVLRKTLLGTRPEWSVTVQLRCRGHICVKRPFFPAIWGLQKVTVREPRNFQRPFLRWCCRPGKVTAPPQRSQPSQEQRHDTGNVRTLNFTKLHLPLCVEVYVRRVSITIQVWYYSLLISNMSRIVPISGNQSSENLFTELRTMYHGLTEQPDGDRGMDP